jgi:serine/threonine protein kinase
LALLTCPACGAGNEPTLDTCAFCDATLVLAPGSIIGSRYEILGALGSGGMGTVYKTHDRVLDERVALKVLKPEFARDSDMARRFQSEIKLARKVSHKNVCRIHEYGEDRELRYLSMEFVTGTDLRQVLRVQGGLLAEGAFEVANEVAAGLQAIHEVGIIHRDLKSPNIMLDSRGLVRLLDFGIAKEYGKLATSTGVVLGTPEYMSPEQAQGESVDFRTDIYALGIVVFEIFTGRLPFQGETPISILYKHVHEPPPLQDAAAEGMPSRLVAVLSRALAKNPAERYQTAGEMAEALRSVQAVLFPSRIPPPPAANIGKVSVETRPGIST